MEYLPEMDLYTGGQSCAILTLSVMNFVGVYENITFMFLCLIHIPDWVLLNSGDGWDGFITGGAQ
jgi:hypothetical protein